MTRRWHVQDPGQWRRLASVVLVATIAAALQWGLGPWLGLPANAVIWLVLCGALVTMGALLQDSRARAAVAEDRLMMAIEGTGIGVFDVDLVQRTFCASPALARLIGLPEPDALAPNWIDRLPVELVRDHCRFLREQFVRQAASYEREVTLNRPGAAASTCSCACTWSGARADRCACAAPPSTSPNGAWSRPSSWPRAPS